MLTSVFQFGEGKVGILSRNDIGLLVFWSRQCPSPYPTLPGSRLKTPVLPLWVTCVDHQYGVVFNPSKDLVKSSSAEIRLLRVPLSCHNLMFL